MTGERVETAGERLRVAMLGTTDGGFIDPDSDVPAGEMYRLAAEVLPDLIADAYAQGYGEAQADDERVRAAAYAQGGRDALTAAAEEVESPADTVTAPHVKRAVAAWLRRLAAQTGAKESPVVPPRHAPAGTNGEDCPACGPDLPYPWICPGEPTAQIGAGQ